MSRLKYDPDADAKHTRFSLHQNEETAHLWGRFTREPASVMHELFGQARTEFQVRELARELHINTAQAQWARTRGVYRFDPDLAQMITDSELDGLSDDVFARLPEWGVYIEIEAAMLGEYLHGAYVTNVPDGRGHMMTVVVTVWQTRKAGAYGYYETLALFADPSAPMRFADRWKLLESEGYGDGLAPAFERALLLAAYLCSVSPDIKSRDPKQQRAAPAKKKNSGPLRVWEVGVRVGNAYRRAVAEHDAGTLPRAATETGRARPRTHVRRAHWRTVLSGPRTAPQRRDLRWFPPTFVNAEGDTLPVTLWKVK